MCGAVALDALSAWTVLVGAIMSVLLVAMIAVVMFLSSPSTKAASCHNGDGKSGVWRGALLPVAAITLALAAITIVLLGLGIDMAQHPLVDDGREQVHALPQYQCQVEESPSTRQLRVS